LATPHRSSIFTQRRSPRLSRKRSSQW